MSADGGVAPTPLPRGSHACIDLPHCATISLARNYTACATNPNFLCCLKQI